MSAVEKYFTSKLILKCVSLGRTTTVHELRLLEMDQRTSTQDQYSTEWARRPKTAFTA